MSDELDVANGLLASLPVDAQVRFTEQWDGALNAAIERRGPIPDPEMRDDVEVLVKLFFIHGYMAAVAAEKERFAQTKSAIEKMFAEYSGARDR